MSTEQDPIEGAEGTVNNEPQAQEPEKKKAFSLVDAHKIFKANGLTAFLDKDSEETFRKDIRKQAFAEFATPIDQVVEELTGIKKEGSEKTKEYISRILNSKISENGSIEELKNNIEKKYKGNYEEQSRRFSELKSSYDELQGKYEAEALRYKKETDQRIVSKFFDNIEFIPDNKLADDAVRNQVVAAFFNEYEFTQTESGQTTVKKDGNIVFDPDAEVGTPIPLDKFFGDYIEEVGKKYGVSKKKGRKGSTPDISQGSQAATMKRYQEQIALKGLYGHEREAILIKQKMGIPLADHEKRALQSL